MGIGKELIKSLSGLKEALKKGEALEDRFKVSRVRRILNPDTGEPIYTRIVTEPKEKQMSLYNLMHGMNANLAVMISPFLPRAADAFPRFRNVFTEIEDSPCEGDLYIYTRMGGGNADCWADGSDDCDCGACDAAGIEGEENCVGAFDDSFDCTYKTFVFKIPDDMKKDWEALQENRISDLSELYFNKLNELFGHREKISEMIEQLRNPKPEATDAE